MTQTASTSDQLAAPGIWHRFRAWFDTPVAAVPGPLEECRETTHPVAVSAQGDAFDFFLYPTFTWRSVAMTAGELTEYIERYTPSVRQHLRRYAAGPARGRAPHDAHRLQNELNVSLAQRSWRFGAGEIDLTCRARVRVSPDERVRASMQPIWQRRIEMEAEHELGMRRAALVRQRTREWSSIIAGLQGDPLTAHAAELTEPEFATVYKEMVKTRRDASDRLIEILQQAVNGHNQIGLYEYANAFDATLKAYQKQFGYAGLDVDDPADIDQSDQQSRA